MRRTWLIITPPEPSNPEDIQNFFNQQLERISQLLREQRGIHSTGPRKPDLAEQEAALPRTRHDEDEDER